MMRAMALFENLQETVAAIRQRSGGRTPRIGIILGSGLGDFADTFADKVVIPYGELPHFPHSSVPGHAGRLILGTLGGETVVAMQGRVHFYEGYSPEKVAFPARVLCSLGIRALVVTNAAGGVNLALRPGDLMAITDHLNLSGFNALNGHNDDRLGPRFPDMSTAYQPKLLELLMATAERQGIDLRKGVYAMLSGPSYETPAEIRMLRTLGADLVGMSTALEAVAARAEGLEVLAVSLVTNLAAGMTGQPLDHAEVLAAGAASAARVGELLAAVVGQL